MWKWLTPLSAVPGVRKSTAMGMVGRSPPCSPEGLREDDALLPPSGHQGKLTSSPGSWCPTGFTDPGSFCSVSSGGCSVPCSLKHLSLCGSTHPSYRAWRAGGGEVSIDSRMRKGSFFRDDKSPDQQGGSATTCPTHGVIHQAGVRSGTHHGCPPGSCPLPS